MEQSILSLCGLGFGRGRRYLRLIEERLFVEEVEDEVEKKLGSWIGSKKQNCLADLKVAVTVKNALKAYEKNKKDHEKSFFVF